MILGLTALLGKDIVWCTFGIYEAIVLVLAKYQGLLDAPCSKEDE